MRYGNSTSRGHGHRPCSYAWKPTIYRPVHWRRPSSKKRYSGKSPAPQQGLAKAFCETLFNPNSLSRNSVGCHIYMDLAEALFQFGLATLAFIVIGGLLSIVDLFITKRSEKTDRRINIRRKTSVNPPPTAEALLAAWEAVREKRRNDPEALAARLRLGSMLADLEPVVDQTYIRDTDGTIIGRRPGLKGWL